MGTNRRRLIAVTSAGLLALIMAAPAAAQDADYLQRIKDTGVITMSTDPQYPPQSSLTIEGDYEGFDIDVGTEIAKRLGVEIAFETPDWVLITAGFWAGRWDFSVGSMTITTDRENVIDFTQPYYYNPAQMAARADLGYTNPDELAGQTICMGEATTYFQWMYGTLDFGTASPDTLPPDGSVPTTLPTDRNCAESWAAGRKDFEGWLSSGATVQGAIDEGMPVVALGAPVFYEPLAVAFDKSVEDNDSLVAEVDRIVGEMHEDGTLTELAIKWFGEDLSKQHEE